MCKTESKFCTALIAKYIKVLRTYRGNVAMATLYVEMFDIIVYEYPQSRKHICLGRHAKLCQYPMPS